MLLNLNFAIFGSLKKVKRERGLKLALLAVISFGAIVAIGIIVGVFFFQRLAQDTGQVVVYFLGLLFLLVVCAGRIINGRTVDEEILKAGILLLVWTLLTSIQFIEISFGNHDVGWVKWVIVFAVIWHRGLWDMLCDAYDRISFRVHQIRVKIGVLEWVDCQKHWDRLLSKKWVPANTLHEIAEEMNFMVGEDASQERVFTKLKIVAKHRNADITTLDFLAAISVRHNNSLLGDAVLSNPKTSELSNVLLVLSGVASGGRL